MTTFTRHYKDNKLVEVSMEEINALISSSENRAIIAEYVYERLYNRFLKIFDYTDTAQQFMIKTVKKSQKTFSMKSTRMAF